MMNDDLPLSLWIVVVNDAHWLPYVFFALINWRQGMRLIRPFAAPRKPIRDRLVIFPRVVSRELLQFKL